MNPRPDADRPRVVVVPGLAVHRYAVDPVRALRDVGYDATLVDPPGWPSTSSDLRRHGEQLAARLADEGRPVDLLVGLSVGTQVAAVCAAQGDLVRRLLLVSPTVAPQHRTRWRTVRGFLAGEDHPDAPSKRSQLPDWWRAGLPRIYRGLVSALGLALEDVLGDVTAELTLAHADADQAMSPLPFAADLAQRHGGRLLVLPDAPHSWPIADDERFVSVVGQLLADTSPARPG